MRVRRSSGDSPADPDSEYGGAVATLEPPMDEPDERPQPQKKSVLQSIASFEITPKKVKRKDLMHFSRQMAVFIKAGIPILDAIDGITEEMGNKKFREILLDMRERLAAGGTFSDAAAAHPDAFPVFYIGVLRTAELSGTLDTVLNQLADYIERDMEARRKLLAAMTYPLVVMGVAVVVVIVLVVFVLPRFRTFFHDLDAKLPLPTRMLLAVTDAFTNYWFVFVAIIAVMFATFIWMMRSTNGRAA